MTTMIDPSEEKEFDFSSDSVVETKEAIWRITEAEQEETESPKGTGLRHNITFESDDWPYPITMKLFVQYNSLEGKDTKWVSRQRGILKTIAKAALGSTSYRLSQLVGTSVRARTKEDQNGFATLSRFKPVG